jgi:hypothetical protein
MILPNQPPAFARTIRKHNSIRQIVVGPWQLVDVCLDDGDLPAGPARSFQENRLLFTAPGWLGDCATWIPGLRSPP